MDKRGEFQCPECHKMIDVSRCASSPYLPHRGYKERTDPGGLARILTVLCEQCEQEICYECAHVCEEDECESLLCSHCELCRSCVRYGGRISPIPPPPSV